jgi:anti-anti-sigma factor
LFTKGVLIKFRTRTSSLFEIIQPVMEKGEVFDSTLLKNMINSLVAEGKRNFAIDLSPLDYIYSDAINVILALNRRILDVSGRLSLMGPSPEVRQILERTGIQNILKIFDTETELIKSSEDIILQTTRYNLADLQNYQQAPPPPPPKPKSEFEDFRSEISTAMAPGVAGMGSEPDRGFRQPAPPPQQQYGAKQAPAFREEEFEAAYKSFEREQDTFAPQPPPVVKRPQPQQYAEPFTPPPVTPPPRQSSQQFKRPEQEFAPIQEPRPAARHRDADFTPPKPPEPVPVDIEEEFHPEPPRQKAKVRPQAEERPGREYEDFSRDEEMPEPKKASAVPAIITIIIVLLLGGGGYFAYVNFFAKGGQKTVVAPSVSQPQEQIPQVSQPAVPSVEQTAPAAVPGAPAAAATPPAEPEKKVQAPPPAAPKVAEETVEKPSKKEKAKSLTKKEKAAAAAATAAVEPVKKPSRPEPEAAGPTGKITITSTPSGATIKADDKVIGVTPYVWNKPSVYGEVTITVSRTGFKDAVKTIEFTGTSVSESFKLEKEEAPVVAKPAPKAAEPEPEAEPVAPPPPKPVPVPKAAPAPEPVAPPPAEEAPAPKAAAGGEAATVFIASIPPVADVYMDGKLIGKTNITKLNVTAGSHSMRFVKGTQEVSKDMSFKGGDNPSQLVNLK